MEKHLSNPTAVINPKELPLRIAPTILPLREYFKNFSSKFIL